MPSAEHEPLPELPDIEILHTLRRGGMGQLLLGRRVGALGFEKLVAVKIIRADQADEASVRTMFFDEARLVARFDHPAIAQVHDFGQAGEILYLVMEYVAGLSLRELLRRHRKPLPPALVAEIGAETGWGLHAAHELGDHDGRPLNVVHRDISPDNLIFTFDGHIKIIDFGIALVRDRLAPATAVGVTRGKPGYMAPEQVRAAPVDRRADIYSLGIVLHELLSARRLFRRDNVVATAHAVATFTPPAPSAHAPEVPAALDAAVLRCLEKDPTARFADARSMAMALDEIASQTPGPTLRAFAETALTDARREHDEMIRGVLNGRTFGEVAIGNADSARTATEASEGGSTPASAPRSRNDTARIVGLVALFAFLVILLAWIWPSSEPVRPSRPRAIVSVDSGLSMRAALPPPIQPRPDASSVVDAVVTQPPEPSMPRPDQPQPRIRTAKTKTKPNAVPPKAEPKAVGMLTVGAQPYALVRMDGKELGATPIIELEVGVGERRIELVHPHTLERRHFEVVTVRAGQHHRIRLEP